MAQYTVKAVTANPLRVEHEATAAKELVIYLCCKCK